MRRSSESIENLIAQRDALAQALWRWTHEYAASDFAPYCGVLVGPDPRDICAQMNDALIHDNPRRILGRIR